MVHKSKFKCSHCGACCKPIVSLGNKDVDRIKKLGYAEEDFVEADHFDRSKMALRQVDGECVFLQFSDGKSKCQIYSNRPDICRKYPFIGKDKVDDCRPKDIFRKAFDEAREMLDKRGFI